MRPLFVYGSLKRGCHNHHHLAGQRFVGEARTGPGYRLYDLGDYPGLVVDPTDTDGVTGELWDVEPDALAHLDEFEGVAETIYRRVRVELSVPFNQIEADTYLYARDPGQRPLGPTWHDHTRS